MENNKTINEINFEALDALEKINSRFVYKKVVTLIILGLVLILSLVFAQFITIIIIIFFYTLLANEYFNKKSEIWLRFANVNGWRTDLTKITDPTYIPPSLFGEGSQRKISPIIHANFEGHSCDIYFYEQRVNENGREQTICYTIARVKVERQLPHIILDSLKSRRLKQTGDATEQIKLEGNFSDYYNVYHKKGEQVDILSVLTPDIMYKIREQTLKQDIEIYDKCVYFIIQADKKEPVNIKNILTNVDFIADEIKHKVSTINYVGLYVEQEKISPQEVQTIQVMNVIPRGILYLFIIVGTVPVILTLFLFAILIFG
jgi:hypothetical protein